MERVRFDGNGLPKKLTERLEAETQRALWEMNVRKHEVRPGYDDRTNEELDKEQERFADEYEQSINNAAALRVAIKARYPGMSAKEVAMSAGISEATLTALKNKGFIAPTPSLEKLCAFLAVDTTELCKGKFKETEAEHPLLAIARSLVGTANEETALKVLSSLRKSL